MVATKHQMATNVHKVLLMSHSLQPPTQEHKSSAGQALKQFISDFGIPDKLVCDAAAEQVGKRTEFQSTVQKHAVDLHVTESHRHNKSKEGSVVQEIGNR